MLCGSVSNNNNLDAIIYKYYKHRIKHCIVFYMQNYF